MDEPSVNPEVLKKLDELDALLRKEIESTQGWPKAKGKTIREFIQGAIREAL